MSRGRRQNARRLWPAMLAVLLVGLMISRPVIAQEFNGPRNAPARTAPSAAAAADEGYSYPKIVMAMGIVLCMIFLLRWGAGKVAPGMATGNKAKAISVVSRLTVAPKQQLMLVKVGRRLVMVSSTGAQISSLCQITDADEIAQIMGQLESEKSPVLAGNAFARLFKGAEEEYAPDEATPVELKPQAAADVEGAGTMQAELAQLAERVRTVSRSFGTSA